MSHLKLGRRAGASLAGQTCNAFVVCGFSKYDKGIRQVDYAQNFAVVDPGCELDQLRQ